MNTYFQFKQFRVEQDSCAMKVSTDACILGAWAPVNSTVKRVLDIGTGTGLLSLMLAQKNSNIHIDAIELNEDAARQAAMNFTTSPWRDRLKGIYADIRHFSADTKYDMIICNPPFFQNSLSGPDKHRNIARHTHELEYKDIIAAMDRCLNENGYAVILLPAAEHEIWNVLLKKYGWYVNTRLNVKPLPYKSVNRIISVCSRHNTDCDQQELCIYLEQGRYSPEFISLLKPYYLQL